MSTTIADVLALPELRECRLLCRKVSCSQIVKSVTVMDNPEILDWLSNREILLSNGSSLANFNVEEWKAFFDGLVRKRAAALFIKLEYFVRRIPDEVAAYTQSLDFPVVVVPNSYSWIRLTDPIQQFMIEQQFYYLKESLGLRDSLNDALMQGGGIDAVCAVAAADIGRQVAVFDEDWKMLTRAGHAVWQDVRFALAAQKPRFRAGFEQASLRACPHYVLALDCGQALFIRLPKQGCKAFVSFWVEKGARPFDEIDLFKAEQVGTALMLCILRESELARIERHYYVDFLLDLSDGSLTDRAQIDEKARRLGRRVHDAYQIVVFDVDESDTQAVSGILGSCFPRQDEDPLRDVLYVRRDARAVLFQPVMLKEDRVVVERACEKALSKLKLKHPHFGVSRPYAVEKAHSAYEEALFALSLSAMAGRTVVYYEDLGLLRLFEKNAHKADALFMARFYEGSLGPLEAYDDENGAALVETLEAFLAHNRSVARTAQALFLHQNTLRARVKRIEEVTGRSLRSSLDIAELTLGAQIHRFLERGR